GKRRQEDPLEVIARTRREIEQKITGHETKLTEHTTKLGELNELPNKLQRITTRVRTVEELVELTREQARENRFATQQRLRAANTVAREAPADDAERLRQLEQRVSRLVGALGA
ncbi:hypothetical protein G3I76_05325, partial [Streptomyces sp. SID11233]|nr:hypothetical protein [Streptomyces sp. SID11233]